MRKSVSRYDIAVKVSEDKEEVIAEVIPEVEKAYNIKLNSAINRDPTGKGFVVSCIQGLNVPFYKISNATFDLSTKMRARLKVPTAIINKSSCYLDSDHEEEDIAKLLAFTPPTLIKSAEEDNLFDSRQYANDIPKETIAEIQDRFGF